jgi:hypothetical protein
MEKMLNIPGWIVIDSDEAEKAKHLFSEFEGTGTVDELGFSLLFDEVAQFLFPWCSTLTTRAKYFYFSMIVVQRALEKTVRPLGETALADEQNVRKIAHDKFHSFQKQLKKEEKTIALMLYSYDKKAAGLFGKRKLERWAKAELDRPLQRFSSAEILQNNSRYPNKIYRGSCKTLDMFENIQNDYDMIERYLNGYSSFKKDWMKISDNLRERIDPIMDNWERYQTSSSKEKYSEGLNFMKQECKKFDGFKLKKEESLFLFKKIQESTPYLSKIPLDRLKVLLSEPVIDLKAMASELKGESEEERFSAAHDIDIVTTPFRVYYDEIVKNSSTTAKPFFKNLKEIERAYKRLNERCPYELWSASYSNLIGNWLKILNEKDCEKKIREAILSRAYDVVRARGKKAPHLETKKEKDNRSENGIKEEIDFRDSSFRIWNGRRILRDIFGIIEDEE